MKNLVIAALVLAGSLVLLHAQEQAFDSDAAIVLEIQRLVEAEPSGEDVAARNRETVADLQKIPPLLEQLDRRYPNSKYRPVAHGLGLNAMLLRRTAGDPTATVQAVRDAAARLDRIATDESLQAHARFVLLQLDWRETSQPATRTGTAPATTTSAPAALAGKFIGLAQSYSKTPYAPLSLSLAGQLYLDAGKEDLAVAAYDRLTRDYAKDPASLNALMILVQLHTQRGRAEQVMVYKRRCVENFPESPAGVKYRSDIAQSESVGKPFFLRFKSLQGQSIDIRNYKGKKVLVYFYATILDAENGLGILKDIKDLAALAKEQGLTLLAVGADAEEKAESVAGILDAQHISVPVLLDSETKVADQYGIIMVPAVAIVSGEGKLIEVVTAANIVPAVKKALAATTTASAPASAPAGKPVAR